MFIAEISILVSFLCFLILFIKKIYPVIIGSLDSYIEKVKEQISSADKLRAEAEIAFDKANKLNENTQREIENFKKISQAKLSRLEKENTIYIENLRKKTEATMNAQLQAELSRQKKILTDKLADLICERISKKIKKHKGDMDFSKEDLKKLL